MRFIVTILAYLILAGQVYAQQCQSNFFWFQDSSTTQTVIAINNSTGAGVLTYYWDFGDGNTSQLAYPTHQYASLGSYEVCLTIMDDDPVGGMTCTSLFCDTVFVTFKSSGFVINVYPESVLGSMDVTMEQLKLFPNPAIDVLNVKLDIVVDERDLSISDIQGKIVYSGRMSNSSYQLDLADLDSGIYFLKIDGIETRTFVKK